MFQKWENSEKRLLISRMSVIKLLAISATFRFILLYNPLT